MRLTRVYLTEPLDGRRSIVLPEAAAAHLTRVLRLAPGAALRVFDGQGGEHDAVLTATGKRSAELTLGAHHDIERESPLRTVLLQGVARGDKMDLIVQKAVELGVDRIVPVLTQRSQVRLDAATAERKRMHWQAVAVSACEQCGRNRVPPVATPVALDAALAAERGGLRLVLTATGEAAPLAGLVRATPPAAAVPVVLVVGPEGGFEENEERMAGLSGFTACRLGPRVLRTETAALAALAALQALAGDFGGTP